MRRGLIIVVVAALWAVSGCSGSDAGASASENPASARPPEDATAAPPPAPAVSSSVAVAQPADTAPAPPGSEPDSIAVLTEGFLSSQHAVLECLAALATCTADSVAVEGSPAHDYFTRLVENYRSNGYEVRLRPDDSYDMVLDVEVDAGGRSGFVTACNVDGDWLVDPTTFDATGYETIINDLVVTKKIVAELRLTEAGWRRWEIAVLQEWPGENSCVE